MATVNRTKKQKERFLICEFLDLLGYSIGRARSPNPPQPDVIVTLQKGTATKKVAVEHTEYFNDEIQGPAANGSPGMRILAFWRRVEESLKRRRSQRRRRYDGKGTIIATVDLNANSIGRQKPRQLAEELLDFLEAHLDQRDASFSRRADFEAYPAMKGLVISLRFEVSRGFDCCHWTCQNTSFGLIGTNPKIIKSAVAKKSKKAAKYKCDEACEIWLLIAASGTGPSNRAGHDCRQVDWSDAELQRLCHNSPFARIFFWERAAQWYKSLKPDEPVVSHAVGVRQP